MILFSPRYFIDLYQSSIREERYNTRQKQIEEIISHVLNISKYELYLQQYFKISLQQYETIFHYFNRRRIGEPLQHILKSVQFRNLNLYVDRGVFIPRRETEQLIDITFNYISKFTKKIVDIGTGSGAIALSLMLERPVNFQYSVLGIDINDFAIQIANKNKSLNEIVEVEFEKSNLLEIIDNNSIDIIVANLPYLSTESYKKLPYNVKYFDPKLALDGGFDGLCYIKRVFSQLITKMKHKGYIIIEIDSKQFEEIKYFISNFYPVNFKILNCFRDCNNIMRFVVLRFYR